MKVLTPGKLILSGEHAVVYGRPALAVAIDRFVETTIQTHTDELMSFDLLNLRYKNSFTVQMLRKIKDSLLDQYHRFLHGFCRVEDVLKKPYQLPLLAFIHAVDHFGLRFSDGLRLSIQSSIPVGCGMGSSAAVILGILYALASQLKIFSTKNDFLNLAYEIENVQHGVSSGLDLAVCSNGGFVFSSRGKKDFLDLPSIPMFVVDTGVPSVTTGQCVQEVAKNFGYSHAVWDDFESVTWALKIAFQNNNFDSACSCIKENHRLLTSIGVVPSKVQSFIKEIEQVGAAAKICGAGAVGGQNGGMVLVMSDVEERIKSTCARYNYPLSTVRIDRQGAHVV